jgi:hypothetical protein
MTRRATAVERGPPTDLYREDFHAWAADQAEALRLAADSRGDPKALQEAIGGLDLENLAEEVAGLAKSEQRELRNRLTTVMEHLLKLQHSPTTEPRPGWRNTVLRSRVEILRLLEDSPSLRAELPALLEQAKLDALAVLPAEMAERREGDALKLAKAMREALKAYTPDRVQDRAWWPGLF